jgi:hypothetical protein
MSSQPRPRAIADLTLAATSTAVNVSLLFLHFTLREWRRTELGDNGEAVLAKLVDQAVKLTGVPEPSPRWVELDDLALIRVRLVLLEHSVIVEVSDRHDRPPTWPDAVLALCARWSSYPTTSGRVAWCELELPQYELTEHGLPRRKPSPVPRNQHQPAVPVDAEVLQRVIEGLEEL